MASNFAPLGPAGFDACRAARQPFRRPIVGAILQKLVREGRVARNAEGAYSVVAGAADKAAPDDAVNGSRRPQAPRFPGSGSANAQGFKAEPPLGNHPPLDGLAGATPPSSRRIA